MNQSQEAPEVLFFDKIKEDRSWYFVEYSPPIGGYKFAILSVVVSDEARSNEEIAKAMESEVEHWLRRYPIPVMASAFDATESFMHLEDVRGDSNLMAYVSPADKVVSAWRLMENGELPDDALDNEKLKAIYSDIPFRTKQQLAAAVDQSKKQMRAGWWVIFAWAVAVPLAVAVMEWWSDWLGYVVLTYAFWKAIEKTLRLKGKWPKSKAEIDREAEELRMRHHHYHCERNPDGFNRLKVENFEKEARQRIADEAKALKAPGRAP